MKTPNIHLGKLNKENINNIKKIWAESLPDNLKNIIGYQFIELYLEKFFKDNLNLGLGVYDSKNILGFVLFGNDSKIIKEIIKQKFFKILYSFLLYVIKMKINYILKYIDVLVYLSVSKKKERTLLSENAELLIMAVRKESQNNGYGSFLLSETFKNNKKYFSKFNYIYVKTLKNSPENIFFYQKNVFKLFYEIFGRVYLKYKVKKNY